MTAPSHDFSPADGIDRTNISPEDEARGLLKQLAKLSNQVASAGGSELGSDVSNVVQMLNAVLDSVFPWERADAEVQLRKDRATNSSENLSSDTHDLSALTRERDELEKECTALMQQMEEVVGIADRLRFEKMAMAPELVVCNRLLQESEAARMEMLSGASMAAKGRSVTASSRHHPAVAAPAKTVRSSGGAPTERTVVKKSALNGSLLEGKPRPNTAVDSRRTAMGAVASHAGPLGLVDVVRLDRTKAPGVVRPRSGLAGSTRSVDPKSGSKVMAGRVVYKPRSNGAPSKQQPIFAHRATKDRSPRRAASTQPAQQPAAVSNHEAILLV